MRLFAHELRPGDTLTIHGSEVVTVADVYRRDSEWVSNGVVMFTATNGRSYGLERYARVEVQS